MRIIGSDNGLKELTVNDGAVIPRQKDGTFHVDERVGQALVKSGDYAQAGTTFRNCLGYRCRDCNFLNLFRKCKCGSENTVEEL